MKGKLINKNDKWYVTRIMDDNGVVFGVDYIIHQEGFDINKSQPMIKLENGKEVDFEIRFGCIETCDGDCGMCNKAQYYAKLIITPNVPDDFQIGPEGAFIDYNSINPKYFGEYKFKDYSYAECSFCGDKTEGIGKFICEECSNALKELVLEKKEYIKKYKSGNPG